MAADPRHKKPHVERKGEYLTHLRSACDDVLIVTAADTLHNARAIWRDLHVDGPGILERFNRPDLISWYYGGVCDVIDGRAPEALTQPLAEVVRQLTEHLDELGFPLISP